MNMELPELDESEVAFTGKLFEVMLGKKDGVFEGHLLESLPSRFQLYKVS